MHELTNLDIEKRAVMRLIQYTEDLIDKIILQGVKELDKSNKLRRIQGLEKKKRLDESSIDAAIKNINLKQYSLLPKKVGGRNKEETKNMKHSQEMNFLSEVI